MFCNMFVLVTDYTLRNMSANDQGIVAVTGRAHCQRQVAFFFLLVVFVLVLSTIQYTLDIYYRYAIVWEKGYQDIDLVVSAALTKVKGVQYIKDINGTVFFFSSEFKKSCNF